MSPSDDYIGQSFYGEAELQDKMPSGAQLEGNADTPHVESHDSSPIGKKENGNNADVACEESPKSAKRNLQEPDTRGTAAKRPRQRSNLSPEFWSNPNVNRI